MDENVNIGKVAVKYGVLAAAGLILYFVLMNLLGLLYIIELRFLNFIFLATMIIAGIAHLQKKGLQGVPYFDGLSLGMGISLVATVIFTLFVYLFLSINPEFMSVLIENAPFGDYLNKYMCSMVVIFEGLASGVIVTYTAMQYFKREVPFGV